MLTTNDSSTSDDEARFETTPELLFQHVIAHIFLPLDPSDIVRDSFHKISVTDIDHSLIHAVRTAAHTYNPHVHTSEKDGWCRIAKMLDNFQASIQSKSLDRDLIISQLHGMQAGDSLAFFVRYQGAAVIFTKREDFTLCESFESSPIKAAVQRTAGSLTCSYPKSAVEMPNEVFDDLDFRSELADFLAFPATACVDPGSRHLLRPDPGYITTLLTGILRGVGRTADTPRVTKRFVDLGFLDVCWRASQGWPLIKVVVELFAYRFSLERASYKRFMLYFMCMLARDKNITDLSGAIIHLMACKILRRLRKLGSFAPNWLSKMALETCSYLREILGATSEQQTICPSPFRNPSQDELIRDTVLSLLDSQEYIRNALINHGAESPKTPFHPNHHRRGTIDDFLSPDGSFFEQTCDVDYRVALHDLGRSIEQGLDEWLCCVSDVDDACTKLEILMDLVERKSCVGNPEEASIQFLTRIQLFIAIDRLVVKKFPMLADYSPEIPLYFLEETMLCKTVDLHRLSCAYQYLAARHAQSRPGWSLLSNEFTGDSFPVRFYDQSSHLQQLKAHIEAVTREVNSGVQVESPLPPDRCEQHVGEACNAQESLLPASLIHAKVIVFELQCPPCVCIWRSVAAVTLRNYMRILTGIDTRHDLLADVLGLQPYLLGHKGPPTGGQIHLSFTYPDDPQGGPTLCYVGHTIDSLGWATMWDPHLNTDRYSEYRIWPHSLHHYVDYTIHTSNDVLATQGECPSDVSLDEFVTFAHLRSGGSHQWLGVLQGLRSRALNLRHKEVHFLLTHAAFQVGPLDADTGMWVWHQELQDSSFCDALLYELDALFADGVGLVDIVLMKSISLLLARVLASSPSEDVLERTIAFLRSVRTKTFSWLQDLSYDLLSDPANEMRKTRLLDMAVTCRSTFDVDPAILPKLLRSAEDVDVLLSCTFFIQVLRSKSIADLVILSSSRDDLFSFRDDHLSPALEEVLRDLVLADPSGYGVDLAVAKIFTRYRPSAWRWKPFQYPNDRWLICHTRVHLDQPPQSIHINLIDGSLRLDDQPFGTLLREITDHHEFRRVFGDHKFFVTQSDLSGMDFMTSAATPEYKVYFSLRDNDLVVRAQCHQTNEIFELIPSKILQKDLPPVLVDGQAHWLNISTKIIEIRPLGRLWERSSENWRIDCRSGLYRASNGRDALVDIRSLTWATLSKCFKCLDLGWWTNDILITASPVDSVQSVSIQRLSVTLPSYGLSFFVNEKEELESREFRNMLYDEDQCIGTLFGLQNLLVLRPKTRLTGSIIPEALIPRLVLTPDGFPIRSNNRVWLGSANRFAKPSYHTYIADTELGCLVGNGDLASTRLLAYLHAATVCYQPDPLTGKLGTQAAISLLGSGGCQSIMECKALSGDARREGRPGPWSSTDHPQINAVHEEILARYQWKSNDHHHPRSAKYRLAEQLARRAGRQEAKQWEARQRKEKRQAAKRRKMMMRAMHLFPPIDTATMSTKEDEYVKGSLATPDSGWELQDVISLTAFALYGGSIDGPNINTISTCVNLWSHTYMCADSVLSEPLEDPDTAPPSQFEDSDTSSSLFLRDSGTRLNPVLVQATIDKVYDILQRRAEKPPRFRLLFSLSEMVYRSPYYQTALLFGMLAAFATHMPSELENPPIRADRDISDGYHLAGQILWRLIRMFHAREWHWGNDQPPGVEGAVDESASDDMPSKISLDPRYWDVAGLTTSLLRQFPTCYKNWDLGEDLTLTHLLPEPTKPPSIPHQVSHVRNIPNENMPPQVTLDYLFSTRSPPELPRRNTLLKTSEMRNNISVLDRLIPSLQTDSPFQREYLALLENSAGVYVGPRVTYRVAAKDHLCALQEHYAECRNNYADALGRLKKSLCPTTECEQVLEQFGQWPPITADVLLRCLASTSLIRLSGLWKKCLTSLAMLLLELQRARRLLRYTLDGLEEDFLKELENEQCDGWDPEDYPDWLLIQVDGNFLIRRAQANTAMEMISPRSGKNTVMQVNMGEGKSSVIIPIVAVALADGEHLVRVVVPKALTVQMFELLVSRLGRLTNRPIYHLPFSRTECNSRYKKFQIEKLQAVMSQCMAERGVLLVQPEHVMSLKLMSVEKQIRTGTSVTDQLNKRQRSSYKHLKVALSLRQLPDDSLVGGLFRRLSQLSMHLKGKDAVAHHRDEQSEDDEMTSDSPTAWVNIQKWLHLHVRDILDESDEILHSRFQLIYTIGLEQHMDGYPDRWTTIQDVLRLVKDYARALSRNHPDSVEYECGPPGSFPHVHIVRTSDVGQRLISMIVEDVMAGRLPGFHFESTSQALRRAIRSFISDNNVLQVSDTAKIVEGYAKCSNQDYLWSGLLLLRGLLSSNILLFALTERRWRVNYGLSTDSREYNDPFRGPTTMLAVPYRAKDVPAPNTQFGHPDLTIILTCLSYYYTGLTEEQLWTSFEILLDRDDPFAEYALWIEDHDPKTLPASLRKLRDINLRSSEQWDKIIFPLFSRNQAAINFYLARVVFPKEAKQFSWKLCGSSWDLGEERDKLITGFSGTNDGRWLLPMSVTQHDLDHQRGSNARVLAYLLQPENDFYMVTHEDGERRTTFELLQSVTAQQPEIRVLLDVGAQILDSSNDQIASTWLGITRDAIGAVYFDESDELTVLTRSGTTQLLSSSPLSQSLDGCVVYLDHAHTRGTDLKLPARARAAVTLGPKVTKDALVQGCMRMRKLGHGHSVMFFAPPGVDLSIRAASRKQDKTSLITTADILCWAIRETWADIQQRAPYWAQQGIDHKKRHDAWSRFCDNDLTPDQLSEAWLQPDAKSLVELYAPCEPENTSVDLSTVPGMQQHCKDLGVLSIPRGQLEEEQEREVNREREREREVEDLPPRAEPEEHFLHPDVVSFVKTGIIPPLHSGGAFLPIFTTLERSSAATRDADVWSPFVLATVDFSRTVKPESTEGTMDQYLRPVQWIMSSKTSRNPLLVVLSPFEVDRLLPDIRVSKHVHLHLYAPRTAKRMKPSDDLRLYTIPPLPSDWTPPWELIDQLNVFAGQLYLRDYPSYLRLCRFLDVPTGESVGDTPQVRRNLFNIPGAFEETEITFSSSPLPSVMALLAIRQRGKPFGHTHMGRILQGQILTRKDFERPAPVVFDDM